MNANVAEIPVEDTSPVHQETGEFVRRHIGPNAIEQSKMLGLFGHNDRSEFAEQIIPRDIRATRSLSLDTALSEAEALAELRKIADKNQVLTSLIGMGYYDTHTPGVILRNVLENPAWYTAYTPYQPEISQGRLEALFNFQTLVTELTGLDIANASLLDEGTAAAEAMALARRMSKSKSSQFLVDHRALPQTVEVLKTRARHADIDLIIGDPNEFSAQDCFGVFLQYPDLDGSIRRNIDAIVEAVHAQSGLVVMACDLLALNLLRSPGELGADIAVGSAQRFGVPMGGGGPHAAYIATRDAFKRSLPGRLVGLSVDADGNPAYRLALQTREQHIRREKATSNICTAQALLAIMASSYAVYHGPKGLKDIALRTHSMAAAIALKLQHHGFKLENAQFFDTLTIHCPSQAREIVARALDLGINLRAVDDNRVSLSTDETTTTDIARQVIKAFVPDASPELAPDPMLSTELQRNDEYLTQEVFNRYHSETEMLRYLRSLADKDIALDRAMIPLGSCTMKLNATSEMLPVSWPEFSRIHPFAPADQLQGYRQLVDELSSMLCEVTGYDAASLQPNAGSQGEYAGLLAIKAWHESRGDDDRNICLIPHSAHGTNPASALMAGMKVVVVKCDDDGNVDLDDLTEKCKAHAEHLAGIMITYPSTHGVFEESVAKVCDVVHQHGGQVYIDGANLNAMVGLCYPGEFGGDVSHLNLHKTFCIPHGGGGPGVGPIVVRKHLAPFLPSELTAVNDGNSPVGAIASAPWGSASILPISWMYIKMMGREGMRAATEVAILNANYIARRLGDHFPVLYTGRGGFVAHECILDIRPIKASCGIDAEDIAKRLIDYGFHAPTMSFPVPGTLMIEPTESESLQELDRFCEAMLSIRQEIAAIEQGKMDKTDNPLKRAPHTARIATQDDWDHAYTRTQAAWPVAGLVERKYWPPVGRVDNVYGDRNLVCSCPPMDAYEE